METITLQKQTKPSATIVFKSSGKRGDSPDSPQASVDKRGRKKLYKVGEPPESNTLNPGKLQKNPSGSSLAFSLVKEVEKTSTL